MSTGNDHEFPATPLAHAACRASTVNINTLSIYLVAGALSVSLSTVLAVFARLYPGTRILKSCAVAILMLSAALVVSSFGPSLPRWVTVVGTNMVLIAASVVVHAGFSAFVEGRAATADRFGWAIVAATALPFWYWGLVAPDGHYRAVVFSLATAIVNGRTAWVLLRVAGRQLRNASVWLLAGLFVTLTVWMFVRGISLLGAEPLPTQERGANPTSWISVAWYMVLVSLLTGSVLWMEFSRMQPRSRHPVVGARVRFSFVAFFRNKLILLWTTVLILFLGVVSQGGLFVVKSYEWEEARLRHTTALANDVLTEHARQAIAHVDALLHTVRSYSLHTRDLAETRHFMETLPMDPSMVVNICVTNARGEVVALQGDASLVPDAADGKYLRYHQTHDDDQLFVGPVERGRGAGSLHFRVTRRISGPDGRFAGVVIGTVDPAFFARYYRVVVPASQYRVSLLGTQDHQLRARLPEPPADLWQMPVESTLWGALDREPSGAYEDPSPMDQTRRVSVYRRVGDFPLVMVTDFSDGDLRDSVHARLREPAFVAAWMLAVVLVLTILLTQEIRRRDEQDRFLTMLSHELKTPLSVLRLTLGMEGVLPEKARTRAQQSVQDMDAIVERCLQVDRLQHHRYVGVHETCQVEDLLHPLCQAHPQARRIAVHCDSLPPLVTDAQLLRTALGNLLDNALKYSPASSAVQVEACAQNRNGRAGIGIRFTNVAGSAGRPDAGQVFRKYYRSPGAHSRTGSGLGLYLVRSIVRRLGGWVGLEPTDGGMVCFAMWLPLGASRPRRDR